MTTTTGLSLRQAAELAAVTKSTVLRALQAGRLSGTRTDDGGWCVEPAEILRWRDGARRPNGTPRNDANASLAALESAIATLREQLAVANKTAEDWKAMAMRALPAPAPSSAKSWWPFRRAG